MELLVIGLCYGVVSGFCVTHLASRLHWVWALPPALLVTLATGPVPWSLLLAVVPVLALLGLLLRRGASEQSIGAAQALILTGIMFAGMITVADQTGGILAPLLGSVVGLSAGLLGSAQARNPVILRQQSTPVFWWMASVFFGMLVFSLGAVADLNFALMSVAAYALSLWLAGQRTLVGPRHP